MAEQTKTRLISVVWLLRFVWAHVSLFARIVALADRVYISDHFEAVMLNG